MFKFEEERISEFEINSNKFKHPIPGICIKPKTETKDSVVFIFNSGLGGTIPSVKYMNYFAFDENYLISYEKMGHGENKNKPTKWKRIYLKELDEVVNWVKKNYQNKRIYLLGESWGSQINMIYYGKHRDKVDGTVNWNAPFNIKNPEKHPFHIVWRMAWKHIATLLFNVTCTLPKVQGSQSKFSRNPILNRALNIVPPVKNNSKATLVVWKYMSASYKWVKKHGKDSNLNFLYVQSGEDVMADMKKIDKLEKHMDNNHLLRLKTGYHVLSFEPEESKILYSKILEFIKK